MGLTMSNPVNAPLFTPVTTPAPPPTGNLTPDQIEQIKRADHIEEAKKALKEHNDKLIIDMNNNNEIEIMNDKNRIQQYQNIINNPNVPSPSVSTTSMSPSAVR